jgi:hypothetical protein
MTSEELIFMAREAGLPLAWVSSTGVIQWAQLERFAALVAAAEREACAVAAWSTGRDLYMKQHDAPEVGMACAAAIRARGEKG